MVLKQLNPKVEVLGYGPITIVDGEPISVEQLITFSSYMTYKSEDAITMLKEIINSEKDINEVSKKSLRGSVRRGHASMTTSAGGWFLFNNVSKFVDSLFTGAIFSSSLMPSGRRIPISLENIVAPDSVINGSEEAKLIYEKTAEKNVKFYLDIEGKQIPREEAAKITPYGLSGGGFIFLPLETILSIKNEFDSQGEWTPKEGNDIIKILEEKIIENGMENLYNNRKEAARHTIPHLNIFTDPEKNSHIKDLENKKGYHINPIVELKYFDESKGFYEELRKLEELRANITSDPNKVKSDWKELLRKRNELISNYKEVLLVSSFSRPSWRVWGEVKRHRTVPQEVESIFNAIDRSIYKINPHKQDINKGNLNFVNFMDINEVFVIPDGFFKKENKLLLNEYIKLFSESLDAYTDLVKCGIPKADAVSIIPRGIRLNVYKNLDLHNLLEGYLPLRSCTSSEKEMVEITNKEIEGIKKILPENLTNKIGPKCANSGFCLEPKTCGKINKYVGFKYSSEIHEKYFK